MFGHKEKRLTRLLIVEDEPLVAFDTERFLEGEGFEIVATVDRVADAIALVESDEEIDLLLLDVSLADGSGIDVAAAAHTRAIPVLFVTGNCPGEAKALAAGCLAKPYQQKTLGIAIAAIEAALDGARPKRLPSGFKLFLEAA